MVPHSPLEHIHTRLSGQATALAALYGYVARACGRRGLTLFRSDHTASAALSPEAQQQVGL